MSDRADQAPEASASPLRERAPAKINLCLFLGPLRADGRHELVTVFESISMADELELSVLPDGRDEVFCPDVPDPNLVADALVALRDAGWTAPPVRLVIHKRIPVAAGLGGGSADAAAAIRLADNLEPLRDGLALEIARRLGADVPSQLTPGVSLGTGAGELVRPLAPLAPHAFVIVPAAFRLSTAEVYREADRRGLPRSADDLLDRRRAVEAGLKRGQRLPDALAMNDLGRAALSLAPEIAQALVGLRDVGADQIIICGSGPTVAGVHWGEGSIERAESAAAELRPAHPGAQLALPVACDPGSSPQFGTITSGP